MIQQSSRRPRPAMDSGRDFKSPNSGGSDTSLPSLSSPGLVSFDMEHKILTGNQYSTPFDKYTFTAFAFVVERATNKSIPITIFAVGDSAPGDFTTTSVEVQATSNFTYDTNNGPITTEVESYTMSAAVTSSTRARILTFSMFLINWALTISSAVIALVVYSRDGDVKDGVSLLPITVITAIPAIRSLYASSPPFGVALGAYQNRPAPLPRIYTAC